MIPITPEILGPGIEEEYADAMERITFLLDAFKHHPASNDTAHGRVVYQLRWLKQESRRNAYPFRWTRAGSALSAMSSVLVRSTTRRKSLKL